MNIIPACAAPLVALSLIIASAVAAQEAPATSPALVVSATRVADTRVPGPASRSVIGRAELEAASAFSLVEVLRSQAGVHVIEQGGRGGYASVLVRAGEPNFTAVFIDGIQVNDSTNSRGGSFDFSTLATADIESIEIIRGPQSAVYGSDALSGVINIVTRQDAREAQIGAEAAAGSDGFARYAANAVLPFGEHSLRATAFREDDGDPVPGSRYELTGGRLSGRFQLAPATELVAGARYADAASTAFPEDSGGSRLAVVRELDRRDVVEQQFSLGVRHELASAAEISLNASRFERDEDSRSPGIAPGVIDGVPPLASVTNFTRDLVSVVGRVTPAPSVSTAVGAELRRERGRGQGSIDFGVLIPTDFGIDREVRSLFAEASYEPGEDWLVNAGLRYDDADRGGSQTTPRLGALYRWRDANLTLRANWGEGFKLPSFFALAFPLIANPDLKAERARNAGIGVDYAAPGSGLTFSVDVFRNVYSDLIDFDAENFTNVNRAKVVTKGAEISQAFASANGRWDVSTYASWQEADIKGSDNRLRGRPKLRAGVAGVWRPRAALELHARVDYTDQVFESSVPTGLVQLDSFMRADVSATWQANPDWQWLAGVQNLFDEDYEQAVGFPSPGRRINLGVRYRY